MSEPPIENTPPFLRLPQVMGRYGCSRSTIYGWMAAGEFPKPLKLGPRLVAWRIEDLKRWEGGRGVR